MTDVFAAIQRFVGLTGTIAGLCVASVVATMLLAPEQASAGDTTFVTGDLRMSVEGSSINATAMMPGDVVYDAITVHNTGSIGLRYTMRPTGPDGTDFDPALGAMLTVTVKTDVPTCDEVGFTGGNVVAVTDLARPQPILGDPSTGNQPGDRSLAPGTAEMLCLAVSLKSNDPSASNGLQLNLTFQFDAEQIAGND